MAVPRDIAFVDRRQPPLKPGEYTVTVTQRVSDTTGRFADVFTSERRLYVRGERFTLDPGETVAVFPPAGSTGEYVHVFPHVVLARHTLPWERLLWKGTTAPWLAVLLFDEDEAPPVQTLRVEDLLSRTASPPGRLPDDALSYAVDASFGPQLGESRSDPCQVIDVPLESFRSVAPHLADLPFLAHVRRVAADAKAGEDGALECSVVVGHRLPPKEGSAVAHLVSLQGLGGYLTGGTKEIPAGTNMVRLVTLRTWTFTSNAVPRSFSTYFEEMSRGPLRRPFAALGRTRAPEGVEKTIRDAFAMGYTAFDHGMRSGDRTVSWYRGPLLPRTAGTIVPSPVGDAGIGAADAALRYDPDNGMLDVTYAAAWEAGRLAALASQPFSTALVAWKRAAKDRALKAVSASILARRFRAFAERAPLHAARKSGASALAGFLASLAPAPSLTFALELPKSAASAASGPTLLPRRTQFTIASRLTSKQLQGLDTGAPVPDAIAGWLRDLSMLAGVPSGYLVPDASMLPPESIRFFVVDTNWINALLQGACSLGRASSFDRTIDDALAASLYRSAQVASPASGFLVRSAAVDAWPGLEVTAYDRSDPEARNRIGAPPAESTLAAPIAADSTALTVAKNEGDRFPDPPFELTIAPTGEIVRCVKIAGDAFTVTRAAGGAASPAAAGARVLLRHPRLRFERIGPSLLLFLTAGTIAEVHVHEPGEGLHFGIDSKTATKQLRYAVTTNGHAAGTLIKDDVRAPVPVPFRDDDERVVDVGALVVAMQDGGFVVDPPGKAMSSAEFALQLVQGVESVVFTAGDGEPS